MKKTVAVMATFDTKSEECLYLKDLIQNLGLDVLLIDVSGNSNHNSPCDITNTEIATIGAKKEIDLTALKRNEALTIIKKGATDKVLQLIKENKINGIISLGGSGGTDLSATVMRKLPIGFPKLIISTLGSSPTIAGHVGGQDIIILNSVCDVAGLNSITKAVFTQGAGAIVGAVNAVGLIEKENEKEKIKIAATMYGVTTPCIIYAKEYLENKGYEVITFHANGSEGKIMESLISKGYFQGVLDVTTTEVSAHVLGADDSAGTNRMRSAVINNIPFIVCPGAMDLVYSSQLEKYKGRVIYSHNNNPSHFRPNEEDNLKVGEYFANQLKGSHPYCAVAIPTKGLSKLSVKDGLLYDEKADEVLFKTIKINLKDENIKIITKDTDINDKEFAICIAKKLDEFIKSKEG